MRFRSRSSVDGVCVRQWFLVVNLLVFSFGLWLPPVLGDEESAVAATRADKTVPKGEGASEVKKLKVLEAAEVLPPSVARRSSSAEGETYVDRIGEVSLAVELFLNPSSVSSRRSLGRESFQHYAFDLSFFFDKSFQITVVSESQPQKNVRSFIGRQSGHSMDTFSMTITTDQFILTFRDMGNAKLYRVVGDTETGQGLVREIDLRKMPPAYHSPSLIPEDE